MARTGRKHTHFGDPAITTSPSPKAPNGQAYTGQALVTRYHGCNALRLFSNNIFQGQPEPNPTAGVAIYTLWSQGMLRYDASKDAFVGTSFYQVSNTGVDYNDLNALAGAVQFEAGNISGSADDEIIVAHSRSNGYGFITQSECTSNHCDWQLDYYAADLDTDTAAPLAIETSETVAGAATMLQVGTTTHFATADVNGDGRADLIFTGAIHGEVDPGQCNGYIINGICTASHLSIAC